MMFHSISKFSHNGRENHSVVSELEGTLLLSRSSFPYFMLVAFEAGGPIRSLLLLLSAPLLWILEVMGRWDVALGCMAFIATVGLKVANVEAVAKAVLPRFYLEDMSEVAYKAISSCAGKRFVVTCMPRIMVEPFLRDYLGVDCVIGEEIRIYGGYCLGLVTTSGLMIDKLFKLFAFRKHGKIINVGLADRPRAHPFMFLCQEHYFVPDGHEAQRPLQREDYPKPLIFHDGRLVARPTPLNSLAILMWLPMGIILATSRLLMGKLPFKYVPMAAAATGLNIRAQFSHQSPPTCNKSGTLYVCSHRTLIDPVMVATALQRPLTAVTYSISSISEVLSPIRTIRLSRNRARDGEVMRALLREGDLVVCPEGTTCREPYLLRFSSLFTEMAEEVVPVAVTVEVSMFYGTSVRGHKWLDPFFFLMNPRPTYYLEFLDTKRMYEENSSSWAGLSDVKKVNSSCEIANRVQATIGQALGFKCTSFTRRDKYRMLAGHSS